MIAGIVSFHCLWLDLFKLSDAGTCSSLIQWWITPVALSLVSAILLGFAFPMHRNLVFLSLMIPSIGIRQLSFFTMDGGPGNLWPIFFFADLLTLAIVWLALLSGAKFRNKIRR